MEGRCIVASKVAKLSINRATCSQVQRMIEGACHLGHQGIMVGSCACRSLVLGEDESAVLRPIDKTGPIARELDRSNVPRALRNARVDARF